MAVSVLAILALLVVPAALVAVVVLVVLLVRRPDPAPSQAAEVARRHGAAVTVVAWLVPLVLNPFLLLAVPLLRATGGAGWSTGLVVALYPTGAALCFLGVHAVGERTWPRPTGAVRRAGLTPRGPVAPRWLVHATLVWTLALAVTLAATALSPVDRPDLAGGPIGLPRPLLGWELGVPLLAGTALTLLATRGVLHLVARRPAVIDADPQYDAASRQLSGHRVLRGTQLVVALTLAGVLGVAAQSAPDGTGLVLGVLALAVALGGIGIALVPARGPLVASGPGTPSMLPPQPAAPWPTTEAGSAR